MATSPAFHEADQEEVIVWACLHAWRALAQLRAEGAAGPLVRLIREWADDERLADDFPRVMRALGPAALPDLTALFADPDASADARISAAESLERVGVEYPDARRPAAAALAATLVFYDENEPVINACAATGLARLGATEALPLIREAYEVEAVDEKWAGSFEEIERMMCATKGLPSC